MTTATFSGGWEYQNASRSNKPCYRALLVTVVLHVLVMLQVPSFLGARLQTTQALQADGPRMVMLMLPSRLASSKIPDRDVSQAVREVQPVSPVAKPVQAAPVVVAKQSPVSVPAPTPVAAAAPAVATAPTTTASAPASATVATAADGSASGSRTGNGIGAATSAAPSAHSQAEENDAQRLYTNAVVREVSRARRYPEAARRAGYSGTVAVHLQVTNGKAAATLGTSSANLDLDDMALEMLKAAIARVRIPDVLQGKTFGFSLPIQFELSN